MAPHSKVTDLKATVQAQANAPTRINEPHIIFCGAALLDESGQARLVGRLRTETFCAVVGRLCTLGHQGGVLHLTLVIEEEAFESLASTEAELEATKTHFARIILMRHSPDHDMSCWIYVSAQ